ncbi:hypothetical protein K445DRAFT_21031 [Daldinia sp. EC12]|nr:hypothetical protein F4774DRAFT_390151 [Daldinia eschscholtzii]OTB16829.1 hypothetical protein K445DRAFT_21031 [Daldinia sp. EC12]
MKIQLVTLLSGVSAAQAASRVFSSAKQALEGKLVLDKLNGEIVETEFVLKDGRTGTVFRRDSGPCCVSPIPSWPGLDRTWTPGSETTSYCDMSKAFGREDDYIGLGTVEDCTVLRDYILETPGAFLMGPDAFLPDMYTGLIGHKTCVVGAGLDPGASGEGLYIGNKDVADVITLVMEKFVKENGTLFTEGYWPCAGPSGRTEPGIWNVW